MKAISQSKYNILKIQLMLVIYIKKKIKKKIFS